jgi:hypothetical protein
VIAMVAVTLFGSNTEDAVLPVFPQFLLASIENALPHRVAETQKRKMRDFLYVPKSVVQYLTPDLQCATGSRPCNEIS